MTTKKEMILEDRFEIQRQEDGTPISCEYADDCETPAVIHTKEDGWMCKMHYLKIHRS